MKLVLATALLSACSAHIQPETVDYSFSHAVPRTAQEKSQMIKWTSVANQLKTEKIVFSGDKSLSDLETVSIVNTQMNAIRYVSDKTDTWSAPSHFIVNGGDCEDYAIAKYAMLKAYGIPAKNMRIAVGYDQTHNNEVHAVLLVTIAKNTYILDNNKEQIVNVKNNNYFNPEYTINEYGFWTH